MLRFNSIQFNSIQFFKFLSRAIPSHLFLLPAFAREAKQGELRSEVSTKVPRLVNNEKRLRIVELERV